MTLEEKVQLIKAAFPDSTPQDIRMYVNSIIFSKDNKGKIMLKRRQNILPQYLTKINKAISIIRKFVNNYR